jgi:hypothetical protein
MPLVSDIWQPNLQHTGPPPGANNPERVEPMVAETVDELKRIEITPSHWETPVGRKRPTLVLLIGEFAPYDGYLQGFFLAYRLTPDLILSLPENGGSVIYSYNRDIAWRKIT